jgi:hypothetical protein
VDEQAAETLALEALAYLASDERRLGALLAQAGWTLGELRVGAGDPAVLAGVLDFVLSDERLVVGFCETAGCAPEMPMRARRALPGSSLDG